MTPWLQLPVVLRRTHAEPGKHLVEEPVDGAPVVVAVLFEEEGAGTLVTLRVSYLLPRERRGGSWAPGLPDLGPWAACLGLLGFLACAGP